MIFKRMTYKGKTSDWFPDNEKGMNGLRLWLFCETSFSCYEAMCFEFSTSSNRNDGLGRFLGWLDDDVYDGLCDAFFNDVIMDALEMDGEYKGITIEEADDTEIEDEIIDETIARSEKRFNDYMSSQE